MTGCRSTTRPDRQCRIRNTPWPGTPSTVEDRVSIAAIAAEAGSPWAWSSTFRQQGGLREPSTAHRRLSRCARWPRCDGGDPGEWLRRRDQRCHRMLDTHPAVVDYLRRVLLDRPRARGCWPTHDSHAARWPNCGRRGGLTRPQLSRTDRELMVQQLSRLFLQPMVDAMWDQLATDATAPTPRQPRLRVRAGPTEASAQNDGCGCVLTPDARRRVQRRSMIVRCAFVLSAARETRRDHRDVGRSKPGSRRGSAPQASTCGEPDRMPDCRPRRCSCRSRCAAASVPPCAP